MNKNKIAYWLNLIGFVLSIISVFMLFLPAMRVTIRAGGSQVGVYNGFQTMFGFTETTVGGVQTNIIGFSFANLAYLLLLLSGIGVWVYSFFTPSNIKLNLITAVLLVAGGTLAFFTVQFVVTTSGADWSALDKTLREGPILLGIIAILSGLSSLASGILSSKANKK